MYTHTPNDLCDTIATSCSNHHDDILHEESDREVNTVASEISCEVDPIEDDIEASVEYFNTLYLHDMNEMKNNNINNQTILIRADQHNKYLASTCHVDQNNSLSEPTNVQ